MGFLSNAFNGASSVMSATGGFAINTTGAISEWTATGDGKIHSIVRTINDKLTHVFPFLDKVLYTTSDMNRDNFSDVLHSYLIDGKSSREDDSDKIQFQTVNEGVGLFADRTREYMKAVVELGSGEDVTAEQKAAYNAALDKWIDSVKTFDFSSLESVDVSDISFDNVKAIYLECMKKTATSDVTIDSNLFIKANQNISDNPELRAKLMESLDITDESITRSDFIKADRMFDAAGGIELPDGTIITKSHSADGYNSLDELQIAMGIDSEDMSKDDMESDFD